MERERLRLQEWHDACDVCGQRFQGIGATCGSCRQTRREIEERQERRRAILDDTRIARGMIPPWNSWGTFDKLATHPGIDRRILAAGKRWRRREGNITFCGPTAAGKTAVAHAMTRRILSTAIAAKELSDEDRRFACDLRWYTASHLALARKQAPLGNGEADAVEDACGASLLVLDELGFETAYDGTLFDIVDRRYVRRLPTIITTGRRESELVDRYGAAFVRRLRELGTVVDAYPKGDR